MERLKAAGSWAITIAGSIILALLLRTYIFNIAGVPTGSMSPTIHVGDSILVIKTFYWFNNPQRGQVIVFKPSQEVDNMRPDNEKKLPLVKRVIAIGGEEVKIVDGVVYVNNQPMEEKYVYRTKMEDMAPINIPPGCFFVLGDNRSNSYDARYWQTQYVTREQVIGRAVCIMGKI